MKLRQALKNWKSYCMNYKDDPKETVRIIYLKEPRVQRAFLVIKRHEGVYRMPNENCFVIPHYTTFKLHVNMLASTQCTTSDIVTIMRRYKNMINVIKKTKKKF